MKLIKENENNCYNNIENQKELLKEEISNEKKSRENENNELMKLIKENENNYLKNIENEKILLKEEISCQKKSRED
jgi:hypothetical protein